MEPTIAAGAIGFIGVFRGYPSGGCEYYVPYDGKPRSIPGVYVSERTGDRLLELLENDSARANIEVVAERGSTTTRNVVGELPGTDDEWVIIGTHHDAPWASAVEDGTGIAMVLAQATAWAAVPESDRPHRLIFLATGAHMAAAAGPRLHRTPPSDAGPDGSRGPPRACRTRQPSRGTTTRCAERPRDPSMVVHDRDPRA